MYRVLVWWFVLTLGYWRFFRPRRIMPDTTHTWIEYVISWVIPVAVSVVAAFGLFGLTVQRFELILARDGLFMLLVVVVDYFYGDALPD